MAATTPKGVLSRDEMEQVIRSGGSVVYQGRLIERVEHIPSAKELAGDDPDATNAAMQQLQDQMKRLQEQLAQFGPNQQQAGAPVAPQNAGNDALAQMALTGEQGAALDKAGLASVEALRAASDDQILAVEGIGAATLKKIREATKE